MTYDTLERSAQDGKPVELYYFVYGVRDYRYTNADVDIVYQSKTYEARPINRGDIEHTAEKSRNSMTMTVAKDLPILDIFRYAPPSEVINLIVYRMHRDDTEAVVLWMGRVLNATWDGPAAKLHCEPIFTSIKRPGLRRHYQRQCPHVLYSGQCGAPSSTYKQTGTVTAITGAQISVSGLTGADGYFAGGYVEWEFETGMFERRAVRSHAGGVLLMTYPIRGLPQGATISIYPGCDHTLATCASRFANNMNYGGMPYIPTKNPFGGSPIY